MCTYTTIFLTTFKKRKRGFFIFKLAYNSAVDHHKIELF